MAISGPKVRVVLVDYNPVVRTGLTAMIDAGSSGEIVGHAAELAEAREELERLTPDVVITEVLDEGGVDPVALMQIVREVSPETSVLVLTNSQNDPDAMNAVRAGVSAYLLQKDITAEMLATVLRAMRDSKTGVFSSHLLRDVVASLKANVNRNLGLAGNEIASQLTSREIEVLRLLARGETNKAISDVLHISPDTVRKHVGRIIEKLGARNRTHAALMGARAGLLGGATPDGESRRPALNA